VLRRALFVCLAACGDDGATAPDAALDSFVLVDADPASDMPAVPPGCLPERAETDRVDDHTFDQIRVLYVVPSDAIDRAYDTNGKICNSVRSFATWFQARSNAYLRFDTSDGLLDVGFVRLSKTDAQMRGTDPNNTSIDTGTAFVRERIERELEMNGMVRPNKLYAVYYDGSSVYACGGGAYPPLIEDRVGAMYLRGLPPGVTQPCGDSRPWGQASLVPNYIDYGMLHEVVHSMGFVPQSAPNQHASGHVFDTASNEPARDLMYSPRGSQDPGWNIDAAGGLLLDIGGDDYFATSPALDLQKSSLLAPLPAGATRPVGW
jgi:hypothetical protein